MIVEFALVAAPFIALLLAILQSSLAYLAQEALESAVEVAARGIVTGQVQAADLEGLGDGMTKAQLAERFRSKGASRCPASCPARGCSSMCRASRRGRPSRRAARDR
ncbi:hypothetical protein GCM10020258_24170 [Sphingomonas yabuuchiae]